MYSFRILSPTLHETAEAAIKWFVETWGIKKSRVVIEESFDADINFRPTFFAKLDDGHLLCVEVSESIYSNTMAAVALDCLQKGLPVKFFVAVPKDIKDAEYASKLKAAKRAGVGVLEVDAQSGTMLQTALSLSLAGVRPLQLSEFPPRYRQPLQAAHQMFRDSDPSKACSLVYDELEAATRRFAKKCVGRKLWKNPNSLNVETASWARVLADLDKGLDRSKGEVRGVTSALMARLVGVTSHRNDSGHKPSNLKQLIARDQALRTRFEGAVDLLKEFLKVTSTLRP